LRGGDGGARSGGGGGTDVGRPIRREVGPRGGEFPIGGHLQTTNTAAKPGEQGSLARKGGGGKCPRGWAQKVIGGGLIPAPNTCFIGGRGGGGGNGWSPRQGFQPGRGGPGGAGRSMEIWASREIRRLIRGGGWGPKRRGEVFCWVPSEWGRTPHHHGHRSKTTVRGGFYLPCQGRVTWGTKKGPHTGFARDPHNLIHPANGRSGGKRDGGETGGAFGPDGNLMCGRAWGGATGGQGRWSTALFYGSLGPADEAKGAQRRRGGEITAGHRGMASQKRAHGAVGG